MKLRKSPNKRLIKCANKFQPWDYGFLLEIEYEALCRMRDFFKEESNCHLENSRYVYKYINIATNLLGMILEKLPVNHSKVNLNNMRRFYKGPIKNIPYEPLKDIIYNYKLWHLYNTIRINKIYSWWD